jgi:hypothetical protein
MLCGVTGRGVMDSKEKKEPQRRRMVHGRGRTWIRAVEEKEWESRVQRKTRNGPVLVQYCKMPENEETALPG